MPEIPVVREPVQTPVGYLKSGETPTASVPFESAPPGLPVGGATEWCPSPPAGRTLPSGKETRSPMRPDNTSRLTVSGRERAEEIHPERGLTPLS